MVPSLNITVVEDHDFLREVIVDLLTKHGHDVHGHFCAEEVDDDPRFGLTDIYIIDLNLPGEDGLSLARRIRSAHPKIGIVMVTARDKLDDKIKGYESGADFYLAKPVDPQELLAVVNAFSRRLAEEIDVAGALKCDPRAMTLTGPEGSVKQSCPGAGPNARALAADGSGRQW
jgi:DNA-binding response OmpR family regulator